MRVRAALRSRRRAFPARDGWWTCFTVAPGIAPTPCWLWTGAVDRKGYAQMRVIEGGRSIVVRVHRWRKAISDGSYVAVDDRVTIGPPDMDAHHTCYARNCINPEHVAWEDRHTNRHLLRR